MSIIANYIDTAAHLEIDEFTANKELSNDAKYAYSLGDPTRGKTKLLFECGKAFNLNRQTMTPFAIAAELMMAAAMNDDDIIDGNESRYGKMPLYLIKGVASAIMTSGYIYGLVFSILKKYRPTQTDNFFSGYVKSENLLMDYFRIMHEGQYRTTRKFDFNYFEQEDLWELAFKKAGLLYQFCVSVPAYLTKNDAIKFEEFGKKLGIAIQFQSDIRDFIAHPDDPDKPNIRFEDYLTGQPNLVLLYAKKSDKLSQKEKVWLVESWTTRTNQDCDKVFSLIKKGDAIKNACIRLYNLQEELQRDIYNLSDKNTGLKIKSYLYHLVSGLY